MAVACVAVLVVNAAISCSVRTEAGPEAVIGAIAATAWIAAVVAIGAIPGATGPITKTVPGVVTGSIGPIVGKR